jgi:acetyl-CoA synthetase
MASNHPVPAEWAAKAYVNAERYADLYRRSIEAPEAFWREETARIDWIKPWTKLSQCSFNEADFGIEWFSDGTLNVSANCLDRHLAENGDTVAIIWEGDDASQQRKLTYRELHGEVCRMANVLKGMGTERGDRVTIYMPMIPEAAVAMLACARIGAIHSIVFGGFSPEALAGRITDCDSKLIITADGGWRGGKLVPLKANVDAALSECDWVENVLVVRHTGSEVAMQAGRDHWWQDLRDGVSAGCACEEMGAEDPLFILYTSGSTGKPKGVLHTSGGYLTWAAMTHHYVFDYRPGDVYWCAADIGWVTGHSYVVYGPLTNGATVVMFEGVPNYPTHSRFWEIVDRHQVNIFYGAPTALRALMREGDDWVKQTSRSSLRLLGSVGEPINPEAWLWYRKHIGGNTAPIVDTWWQTETGGIMISPLPGVTTLEPGSAQRPIPGISAEILDDEGMPFTEAEKVGYLVLTKPWPAMLRGIWGDPERYKDTYWTRFGPKYYFAGDGAKYDEKGNIWLLGRVDDVMNVSGHRLSTAEIESALVSHPAVAEAAVVGASDETTGQAVCAFVILRGDATDEGDATVQALRNHVAHEIGPIAKPRSIMIVPELPKTRSGKIMRRLLKDVAEGRDIGDATTLADSSVMSLIAKGMPGGGSSS